MSGNLLNLSAVMAFFTIPSMVIWSYLAFGLVLAIGLVTIFLRGDWQKARGLDKLILFGPLFYAAPLAAFGTEHFTLTKAVASIVPRWIPWHLFWAYFVGACFIAAALSLVTKIQAPLAARLLALTFFLFVVLMDAPGWAHNLRDRFGLTLTLRELSFSGGALALAASLAKPGRERSQHVLATIARYFIAIPVLFYSFEQFMHPDHVPAVPLERLTPQWIFGHAIWTYLVAVVYASRGCPVACRQENPRRSHVDRPDRALRGVSRVRADRSRGARQPRRPQLHGGYTDVLWRHSSARGRHAARSGAAGITGGSVVPRNPPKPAGQFILTAKVGSHRGLGQPRF